MHDSTTDQSDKNISTLNHDIPYHIIEVIKSLYKNTSTKIDTGRKILEKTDINQEVRQGCNLPPVLFNIYIDDLL